MNKQEILQQAMVAREQEVLGYQINIDNYTLALQEIAVLPPAERDELAQFKDQLTGLLASEKLEQKKSKIMLAVIKRQLEVL